MKKSYYKIKNKLYFNILMVLIFAIVTTIIIISTVLHMNFKKISLNLVYSNGLSLLEQSNRDINMLTNTASTISTQISNDWLILKLLSNYEPPNIYDVQASLSQLNNFCNTLPFIDSVYVYNRKTNSIYTGVNSTKEYRSGTFAIQDSSVFEDKGILDIIKNFNDYKPYSPIPRKIKNNGKESTYYTFFAYNWLNNKDELTTAVFVNVSAKWIHEIIEQPKMEDINTGEIIMINSQGEVVSDSENYPMFTKLSDKLYIENILDSKTNGYIIDKIDGIKYHIAYTLPDSLGWQYLKITRYSDIVKSIDVMQKQTITFAFVFLLFGIVFATIASRTLYYPIQKIISTLNNLNKERNESFFSLKQTFLKTILLQRCILSSEQLKDRFEEFRIDLGNQSYYTVAKLKIDYLLEFQKKCSQAEQNLMKFAIMNIAIEGCSSRFKAEAVDVDKGCVALILARDPLSQKILWNEFKEIFFNIQTLIEDNFKISITVCISEETETISDIENLYHQVSEGILHGLFYGRKSIISAQTIMNYSLNKYIYPIEKERNLLEAIMIGKTENAVKLYTDIIHGASEFPFFIINITISRLNVSVNSALSILSDNHQLMDSVSFNLLTFDLKYIEVVDEINQLFIKTINLVFDAIVQKRNGKYDTIVNKINTIILTNYMDRNLSIESIADKLSLSPSYVSRIYKQHMTITILERITIIRIDVAKNLLLQTDYPIAKISELAGFSDASYFYRIFKKENGITPKNFRSNSTL